MSVTFKYIGTLEEVGNSIVVDKTPDPACGAPGSMTAAAGLLFQFVWAELPPKAKSL